MGKRTLAGLVGVPHKYWLLRLLAAHEGVLLPGESISASKLCMIASKNSRSAELEPKYSLLIVLRRYIQEGYFKYTHTFGGTYQAKWLVQATDKGREYYNANRKTLWEMDNVS